MNIDTARYLRKLLSRAISLAELHGSYEVNIEPLAEQLDDDARSELEVAIKAAQEKQ